MSISKFMTAFILLACIAPMADVYACTFPPSTQEKFARSDVVFLGSATSVKCAKEESFAEFSVDKIWKGEKKPTYIIHFDVCSEDSLKKNRKYLVFAKQGERQEMSLLSPYCPGSIAPIRPRWKEWLALEYAYFKKTGGVYWSFYVTSSVNKDLEILGEP